MTPAVRSSYQIPLLETPRLLLRPLTLADTDFIFAHFSDPLVTQHLLDEPPLTDRAGAEEIIHFYLDPNGMSRYNRWGIHHKADDRLIGTCGYHQWSHQNQRAEIGYDLSPAYWGQGMMSEALRRVLAYGFVQMGLNRIQAVVYVENDRSATLLARMGFAREGVMRDYHALNGQYYDHVLFALLRREYRA
ncbi:MAG: GNAT family N-acetyltransferase [Anaerolineales bacterium]|nr:GNAT family N-acetyltransferase [Anaerolineales bacterium]